MPFTASHPAAILPLLRVGLVPSAAVIGSVAPDVPYYLRLPVAPALTHSAVGIVSIDLLMGAVAFVIWHAVLGPTAVALAPAAFRARLAPRLPVPVADHLGSAKAVAFVVTSLVIGSVTHVLWDSFTHEGRWGVRQIDVLSSSFGPLDGYRWAQYGSGVVGLLAIALTLRTWWRRQGVAAGEGRCDSGQRIPAVGGAAAWSIWAALITLTLAAGLLGFVTALDMPGGTRLAFYRAATWGGGAGLVGLLLVASVVTPIARRRMAAQWPAVQT